MIAPPSEHRARFFESEARQTRMQFCRIAVAEVAEEVGFDVADGEELLFAAVARRAGAEELLVDLRVVETGKWSAVEADGSRGHHQICALQGRIPARGRFDELRRIREEIAHARIVRKELRHLAVEVQV